MRKTLLYKLRYLILTNALAAGDLGFGVTFFSVTSAIFGQNRDF